MKKRDLTVQIGLIRTCKAQARELLNVGNNRLYLAMAICLWIATAGAIFLGCGSIVYAADESVFTDQPSMLATALALLSYALMLLLALLLLVPMAGGVMLVAERIYLEKPVRGSDLFMTFSSFACYVHCFKLGLYSLLWPLMLVAVVALSGGVAANALYEIIIDTGASSVLAELASAAMILPAAALGFLVLYICRGACVTGVLMMRGMKRKEAKFRMRRLCRKGGCALLYYRLSFLGWTALSVLTVGAFAVIDTLPYMLLSHQFLCDALIMQENKKSKINK